MPFPGSLQELEAFRASSREAAEQRKTDAAQAQRERADRAEALAAELRTQLAAATGRAEALAEQQAGQKHALRSWPCQLGQQGQEIEQLKQDLATARKPRPKPAPLTRCATPWRPCWPALGLGRLHQERDGEARLRNTCWKTWSWKPPPLAHSGPPNPQSWRYSGRPQRLTRRRAAAAYPRGAVSALPCVDGHRAAGPEKPVPLQPHGTASASTSHAAALRSLYSRTKKAPPWWSSGRS